MSETIAFNEITSRRLAPTRQQSGGEPTMVESSGDSEEFLSISINNTDTVPLSPAEAAYLIPIVARWLRGSEYSSVLEVKLEEAMIVLHGGA